ncbi:chemotaxis protein CheW [Exilibacterium tricleocarpae]|uniref:Chemotaxis protein CheW n=1 Tax=Exilibacterium tricleocarpae TaxID=2591008 RepID=A0A545U3Y4_9GAMM|nr:chemotaxis protein CheW [Exilibacterium tricleocarpae]TQV84197.1 chemotaxis protein CheW [Exilibacterium tricleocarpae]
MSERESPQDTLQQYFDELLLDTAPPADAPAPLARPPAPSPVPETAPAIVAERAERVAKLLQSRPLMPDPPPATEREPVPPAPVVDTAAAAIPLEDIPAAASPVADDPLADDPLADSPPADSPVTDNPTAEAPAITVPITEDIPPQAETTGRPESEAAPDVLPAHAPVTAAPAAAVQWLDNGRPDWAQARFEALLFQVSGLTLAVPLISLGQIQPLNDALTPLFGQADWFMGLQPTPMGDIRTLNTAKFVMPERYNERFLETAKYVISISGLSWGMAVDSVNQPITLDPDDVIWRTQRSRRPWLAGTVKEHMCALIDVPMMGKLLVDAEKP